MADIKTLPETGFLNLYDIVCRPEITPEQSAATYRAFEDAKVRGDAKAIEKARFNVRKPRCATRGLLPISKSTWLNGVRTGKYPKPVKLGPKTTVWRVEDIRALINSFSQS
ncbi:helix-turn-helix transcriptional regulator [Dechloromonas sp. ARDL1]|uniref:helix-turn-helix transcriptional regulator n=1 Tax=Dechloromonas sp. ARDL1 TaxID=3322121 RepID=UPI003DA6F669